MLRDRSAEEVEGEEEELEKRVFEEINETKAKFAANLLENTKDLILEIARALEKIRSQKSSICQEIKSFLKEEISRHMISERTIEKYSLQEWKSPEFAEFGRKGAIQIKKLAEEISASADGQQKVVMATKEEGDKKALSSEQEDSKIQMDAILPAFNHNPNQDVVGTEGQELQQPKTRVIEFGVPVREVIIEGRRALKEGNNSLAYFMIELDIRSWRVLSASAGRLSDKSYKYNTTSQLFSEEQTADTTGGNE
jgi:hypothetical protein